MRSEEILKLFLQTTYFFIHKFKFTKLYESEFARPTERSDAPAEGTVPSIFPLSYFNLQILPFSYSNAERI